MRSAIRFCLSVNFVATQSAELYFNFFTREIAGSIPYIESDKKCCLRREIEEVVAVLQAITTFLK